MRSVFYVPGNCIAMKLWLRRTLVHWQAMQLLPKRRVKADKNLLYEKISCNSLLAAPPIAFACIYA